MAETQADRRSEELPARVTMPLLTMITQQSLDEDYLHSAERRAARGETGPTRGQPRRLAAVMVAVFGILVTTAAIQTSRNADVSEASRARLVTQVLAQREHGDALAERAVRLRDRTDALRSSLTDIGGSLQSVEDDLERLEVRTGATAVRGPGVRVTVDDPGPGSDERIRKEDLFLVINGLWEAGAEAIALNGHRLGVLTSVNNSDVAINVDSSALLPPYTLEAIGGVRLGPDLLDTATFAQFEALKAQYGFGLDLDTVDELTLPAARSERLRSASATTTDPDHRTNEGAMP